MSSIVISSTNTSGTFPVLTVKNDAVLNQQRQKRIDKQQQTGNDNVVPLMKTDLGSLQKSTLLVDPRWMEVVFGTTTVSTTTKRMELPMQDKKNNTSLLLDHENFIKVPVNDDDTVTLETVKSCSTFDTIEHNPTWTTVTNTSIKVNDSDLQVKDRNVSSSVPTSFGSKSVTTSLLSLSSPHLLQNKIRPTARFMVYFNEISEKSQQQTAISESSPPFKVSFSSNLLETSKSDHTIECDPLQFSLLTGGSKVASTKEVVVISDVQITTITQPLQKSTNTRGDKESRNKNKKQVSTKPLTNPPRSTQTTIPTSSILFCDMFKTTNLQKKIATSKFQVLSLQSENTVAPKPLGLSIKTTATRCNKLTLDLKAAPYFSELDPTSLLLKIAKISASTINSVNHSIVNNSTDANTTSKNESLDAEIEIPILEQHNDISCNGSSMNPASFVTGSGVFVPVGVAPIVATSTDDDDKTVKTTNTAKQNKKDKLIGTSNNTLQGMSFEDVDDEDIFDELDDDIEKIEYESKVDENKNKTTEESNEIEEVTVVIATTNEVSSAPTDTVEKSSLNEVVSLEKRTMPYYSIKSISTTETANSSAMLITLSQSKSENESNQDYTLTSNVPKFSIDIMNPTSSTPTCLYTLDPLIRQLDSAKVYSLNGSKKLSPTNYVTARSKSNAKAKNTKPSKEQGCGSNVTKVACELDCLQVNVLTPELELTTKEVLSTSNVNESRELIAETCIAEDEIPQQVEREDIPVEIGMLESIENQTQQREIEVTGKSTPQSNGTSCNGTVANGHTEQDEPIYIEEGATNDVGGDKEIFISLDIHEHKVATTDDALLNIAVPQTAAEPTVVHNRQTVMEPSIEPLVNIAHITDESAVKHVVDIMDRSTTKQVTKCSDDVTPEVASPATGSDNESRTINDTVSSESSPSIPVSSLEATSGSDKAQQAFATKNAAVTVVKEETKTDITLYGCTSFTAKHVLNYFMQTSMYVYAPVKLTLAGRNNEKLQTLLQDLNEKMANLQTIQSKSTIGLYFDVFVADSTDARALKEMAKRTKVVVNCAGPFAKYGSNVVAACAENGADYVDITGEVTWAGQMRVSYGDAAKKSGARIISFCGFDSIPSDLSIFASIQALRDKVPAAKGLPIREGTTWHCTEGSPNGGTVQTVESIPLNLRRSFAQAVPFFGEDPLVLTHPRQRFDPLNQEIKNAMAKSEWMNQLLSVESFVRFGVSVPFFMAITNSKVVYASSVALGYGKNFLYRERMFPVGFEPTAKLSLLSLIPAILVQVGTVLAFVFIKLPVLGKMFIDRFFPPGSGPSDQACQSGKTEVYAQVTTEKDPKTGQIHRANCHMKFSGDPGNFVTAQCLCEAAWTLLLHKDELPMKSDDGFGTPAELLGPVLLRRLMMSKVRSVSVRTNARQNVSKNELNMFC